MIKFKAIAKTNTGLLLGTFDVEIDTDEPLGEGDVLILGEEVEQ